MRTAAPEGQAYPDRAALRLLGELTRSLRTAREGTVAELDRFLAVRERGLCLPEAELAHWLDGVAVLVTGGTGCIGSTLMAQLAARHPGRLVSLSRGVTDGWPRPPAAEYRLADIRDRAALHRVIQDVRPDVVFHVAAQRSPALAEVEVHRTVSTNVLGTRNVLAEAAAAGVPQVITASTGKALRPYSPEVYTASKRAAEWLASAAADDGMLCGTARFAHVLDNSIIYQRLLGWARDGVVGRTARISRSTCSRPWSRRTCCSWLAWAAAGRVPGARHHRPGLAGQPAGPGPRRTGPVRLGRPGLLQRLRPGLRGGPFPGLYDPATAGDTSPLLNAFETATVSQSPCPWWTRAGWSSAVARSR